MKKMKLLFLFITVLLTTAGCTSTIRTADENRKAALTAFTREKSSIDYSSVAFTPWNTETIIENADESQMCDMTIMIYMNGSDLESENGAATDDIMEILSSGADTERMNIIIFTGGTNRWRNNTVPAGQCALWRIENSAIKHISDIGVLNMGDAGTLAGFIEFAHRYFPARQYGLILWDHGGGSIAGYGHDEVFNGSSLTLLEMDYAFYRSPLKDEKLEFLGFDACLMATAEMAVVASDYAKFLIASEDLEPGDGWDYRFLGEVKSGSDGKFSGAEIGKLVTNYFMSYYGYGTTESVTMSVTDLAYAKEVMSAMGRLMERCHDNLVFNERQSWNLAKRRYRTHAFGEGTRRDNDCDMVDLSDVADSLQDIFPEEASVLRNAVQNAVVYNRHNSLTNLGGLTAYYIFGGKDDAENSLTAYSLLGMSREYTDYLIEFARFLRGADNLCETQTVEAGEALWEQYGNDLLLMVGKRPAGDESGDEWPHINGRNVCMDSIGKTAEGELLAIPVQINGSDADIVVFIGDKYPDGIVLGTRREEGYIIQKGHTEIDKNDEIAFYYRTCKVGEELQNGWALTDTMTAGEDLKVTRSKPENRGRFLKSTVKLDTIHGERYEKFVKL